MAFSLIVPLLLVRIFWRGFKNPNQRERWYERIGFYGQRPAASHALWVHAVSVGESIAAVPLIRALQRRFRGIDVVVTTTTLTGAESVRRMLGESVTHVYFPYDVPWVLGRFLARFRPQMLLVLETELWPNMIALCRRRNVPVLLVNARLSEHSLQAYLRVASLSRSVIALFNVIAPQSSADAQRFRRLGASAEQLRVTGSLKFDLELPASLHEQAQVLRRELGVNRPILMLGSTREGEEAILLVAAKKLLDDFPDLLLVVAPRHPERFADVQQLCANAGLVLVRHSAKVPCAPHTQVYLVDAMGELPRFYAASDVAFVGGSLLPFGGHNVLEPAALGTPVISGPYTHNFAEICDLLSAGGVLQKVDDAEEFATVARHWLRDSNERDRIGQIGRDIVRTHAGATRRTVELVEEILNIT